MSLAASLVMDVSLDLNEKLTRQLRWVPCDADRSCEAAA
jgi:hypothetical protein